MNRSSATEKVKENVKDEAVPEDLALLNPEDAGDEDGLLADVKAMTGGAIGQDAIARLEVRFFYSSSRGRFLRSTPRLQE